MTQTITRMYSSPQQAMSAEATLREQGFGDDHIRLVVYHGGHPAGSNSADSIESVTAQIAAGNVRKAHAAIYAQGVIRGGSLLTVHAPFGTALLATEILDSFDPVESGISSQPTPVRPWDEAAPISSALRIGVRLDHPALFSVFWNLPVLLDQAASLSVALGIPVLVAGTASLSKAIGLPALASRFSVSQAIGIPALASRFSMSQALGLPVLLKPRR
jgi:hypothetical protein